jgi:integrase
MMDGRLEEGTFLDYKDALETFIKGLEFWRPDEPDSVALLKREAPVSALRPEHFRHVRKSQSLGVGSYVLERRVQGVRTAFRWGWEIGRLIPGPPYYGDDYHKPSKADKRADKRKTLLKGGEPRFSVKEIATILNSEELKPALTAMVWLVLNGGMYSADCAVLRWSDVRKEGASTVIDTYRERACP